MNILKRLNLKLILLHTVAGTLIMKVANQTSMLLNIELVKKINSDKLSTDISSEAIGNFLLLNSLLNILGFLIAITISFIIFKRRDHSYFNLIAISFILAIVSYYKLFFTKLNFTLIFQTIISSIDTRLLLNIIFLSIISFLIYFTKPINNFIKS